MNFLDKNILLISPEPWGDNHVSKHHYALELVKKGANVFFLNGPSQLFSKTVIEGGVVVLDYKPKYRGLGKMPKIISAYLLKKEVSALEVQFQLSFDVIWNFDSSRFFNLSAIKDKLRICHIVDMAENIQRDLLAKI